MRTGSAKATLPLFGKADTSNKFEPNATLVILEGDSAETLKTIPDASIKLIVTSPPYNIGKVYEEATQLDAYLENLTPIVEQLIRVLADDGSLCWQVGNYVEKRSVTVRIRQNFSAARGELDTRKAGRRPLPNCALGEDAVGTLARSADA